jgi:hypothetical protein
LIVTAENLSSEAKVNAQRIRDPEIKGSIDRAAVIKKVLAMEEAMILIRQREVKMTCMDAAALWIA